MHLPTTPYMHLFTPPCTSPPPTCTTRHPIRRLFLGGFATPVEAAVCFAKHMESQGATDCRVVVAAEPKPPPKRRKGAAADKAAAAAAAADAERAAATAATAAAAPAAAAATTESRSVEAAASASVTRSERASKRQGVPTRG